jgi:hypothetical protein
MAESSDLEGPEATDAAQLLASLFVRQPESPACLTCIPSRGHHRASPGAKKTVRALAPYEIWFTGLRREQSPTRKNLKKVEQHRLPSGKQLLKVSPLRRLDVGAGMGVHDCKSPLLSTAI